MPMEVAGTEVTCLEVARGSGALEVREEVRGQEVHTDTLC